MVAVWWPTMNNYYMSHVGTEACESLETIDNFFPSTQGPQFFSRSALTIALRECITRSRYLTKLIYLRVNKNLCSSQHHPASCLIVNVYRCESVLRYLWTICPQVIICTVSNIKTLSNGSKMYVETLV